MFGTARSIINNMVIGVVDGYEKKLEIKGVGFRAVLEGDLLDLALGYSHPIKVKIPEGITVKVDQNTNCLLYTSPSPRDGLLSRMPSSA